MAATRIHIALLDCDTPVPNVLTERGMYSDIFRELIIAAATKRDAEREVKGQRRWKFSTFHCVKGELPSEVELKGVDGVVITGSASSAYDDEAWIKNLITWTRNTYISYPNTLLFGSCFGHQLICQALFTPIPPHNSVITRSPQGWELGIQPINLSPAFVSHYGAVINIAHPPSSPDIIRMQFVHADHLSPLAVPALPAGFTSIGQSKGCEIQGIWQRDRVLTYQGHIEFDGFVNSETIKVFGTLCGWGNEEMATALESTIGEDDAAWATGVLVQFLEEGVASRINVTRGIMSAMIGDKVQNLRKQMSVDTLEIIEVGAGA